jgi:hypothetical protein
MSKKSQFNTFCRISDFLEFDDAEYLEFLKGTCVISQLSSKGMEGRTLLIYKEASTRKKIQDLIYSMEPADVKKGRDILAAAIFRGVYRNATDWKNKPPINSLFPSQQVDVDPSTAGKEVKFKSGAVATLADKFIDSSPKNNLAVWYITKGEIPVTTDKTAKLPPKGAKKGSYAGGYTRKDDITGDDSYRLKIVESLEKKYKNVFGSKTMGTLFGKASITGGGYDSFKPLNKVLHDPFLEAMLSLASFTRTNYSDVYYNWVLPHVSFNKIDIYLMIQPYNRPGTHFIGTKIIREWYESNPVVKYQKIIDTIDKDLSTHRDSSALYSNRIDLMHSIDKARSTTIMTLKTSGDLFNRLSMTTQDLETSNTIEDTQNAFPEELHKYYKDHSGLKLAEDELRYVTNIMFENAREPNDLEPIYTRIELVLRAEELKEFQSRSILFVNKIIASFDRTQSAVQFINSTYFMFIPLTCKEIKNLPFKIISTRPAINSKLVYELHSKSVERAKKTVQGSGEDDVIRELNGIDASSDEELKTAIIAAYNRIK